MAGGLRRGASAGDVGTRTPQGRRRGARLAVAAWEGRIVAVGAEEDVARDLAAAGIARADLAEVDAAGCTITPGLVDAHTHLLFAGERSAEIGLRQRGAGYLEILEAGGGILSTVAATRAASTDELLDHGRRWLAEMLRHGTTTVEAKSGYGLDTETELRLLDVLGRLGREGPIEVVPTFLGAHAVPAEFRGRDGAADVYADSIVEEQLPAVARQGIARFCDAFCERGVFDVPQARRVLEAGREHGLEPRLHADQLEPSGGAELAAELRAASADHLSAPSREGIAALAEAADGDRPVVVTLLPTTGLFLADDAGAPARTLVERRIPVALGTDFNPGTSPAPNMALALSLACLRLRLSAGEALAAATINAAHALRLGHTHGSLEPGRAADIVVWDVPSHALIPYWLGADLVRTVVKRGRVAWERS